MASRISVISSFSGIVSNINGYAFSEFFECQRPAFFEKVDGSIRNVPNALGVIDSTVSSKEHKLYELYQGVVKKENPLTYIYDTDWAIIGGLDRADPLKQRTSARTVFTVVAKGLPGSRKNPAIGRQASGENEIDKVLGNNWMNQVIEKPQDDMKF